MPRHRQSVQRYHDRVASRYDAMYDDAYWAWHDSLTWEHVKAFLPRASRAPVVDLGCGTGKWGCKLLGSGYAVTFVDISARMLDRARAAAEATGHAARASFVRADLSDLCELPAGEAGLVVAMGEPLGSVERPAKALKEVRRILAPGAVVVATFDNRLAGIDHYLEAGRLGELEAFLKTGRTHWLTRDRRERFELHTFTPAQLTTLFERAKLDVLDLIGKTVLPMRHYRRLLEDPAARRKLARMERRLHRDPAALGRCAHLQIAARRI